MKPTKRIYKPWVPQEPLPPEDSTCNCGAHILALAGACFILLLMNLAP